MTSPPRSTPDFRLRCAKSEDYRFALALYLDGSRHLLERIGRWDEKRLVSRFRRGFKPSESKIIESGDLAVGWIQIVEGKHRLHLRQIHLVPEFRGLGIGTLLIEDLLAQAKSLDKAVTLDVMHGNPARSLYERLGFERTGADLDKIHMLWRPEPSHESGGSLQRRAG